MRFTAFFSALLCACAGATAPVRGTEYGSSDAGADASHDDAGDASVDARALLLAAPPLDVAPPSGFSEEASAEIAVENETKIDIAFATDSCVRVAFASGDPLSVVLGDTHVEARTHALLGPRGPLCERAGKHLTLIFSGNANARYVVFRSQK